MGQNGTTHDIVGVQEQPETTSGAVETQVEDVTTDGTNGQGPTPCGIGPLEKRVKGVEPSTFTLAT